MCDKTLEYLEVIRSVLKLLVQDALNSLISMAVSVSSSVFWDFGCFGCRYFGIGHFGLGYFGLGFFGTLGSLSLGLLGLGILGLGILGLGIF